MPKIAGHTITERQLYALHGLYKGALKGTQVYGVNVSRQLATLADQGVIQRTGWSYTIPFGGPGEAIINATPDYTLGEHISGRARPDDYCTGGDGRPHLASLCDHGQSRS